MTSAFSWVNHVDRSGASFTAGDQSPGLPVTNLADRIIQKVFRSGSSYSTNFTIDFGASVSVRLLGLFGCTLTAGTDTVRHRLSNVSSGAGEAYDSGVVDCGVDQNYGVNAALINADVTARYWRCDVVANSRSSNFSFDIGRAWAGQVWVPGIGFSVGWGQGFVDTTDVTRARHSGVTFPSEGSVYRKLDFTFDNLLAADRDQALTLDRVAGKRSQIVFLPSTTDMTTPLIGRMAELSQVMQPTSAVPARFSKRYTIEQDL